MPAYVTVKKLYRQELTARALSRMQQAGPAWTAQQQAYYVPGNEQTVDQCALAVLSRSLLADGREVNQSARKRVRHAINLTTSTERAINIIYLTCLVPE